MPAYPAKFRRWRQKVNDFLGGVKRWAGAKCRQNLGARVASSIKLRLEPHPEFGSFNRLEKRAKRFLELPHISVAEVIELFAKQVTNVAALSAWSGFPSSGCALSETHSYRIAPWPSYA